MKKAGLTTFLAVGLVACSYSQNPTEEEVQAAFAETVNTKGCASSVLFKKFPISELRAEKNQNIIQPFISIGFIEKNGDAYNLTEEGSAVYDPSASGFCYTQSYVITDVSVVKDDSSSELPPALSGAWYVSFTVSPGDVDEWAKDPEIIRAASRASLEEIVGTESFTVRVAKKHGEEQLFVADPRFRFAPGIHFNMGF